MTIMPAAGLDLMGRTHIWPAFDMQDILEEVKEVYKGKVALAREGMELHLGGGMDVQA
jgi:ribonuclease BN (tRNA processing enzyme)